VDVHQDGSAFNISEGILRRSHQEAQNPSAAEKVREIHIELWPLNVISAKQTLSHGSEYTSRLVLPMIPARSSGVPVITGCPQTVSV
jgi:hypothetical protein